MTVVQAAHFAPPDPMECNTSCHSLVMCCLNGGIEARVGEVPGPCPPDPACPRVGTGPRERCRAGEHGAVWRPLRCESAWRAGEALCLLGNHAQALAYTAEDVVAKIINYGGILSAQRVHAVALAATGEAAAAAALFEATRACAAEQGLLLPQVRVLLDMVACGVGGEDTPRRLGALLRQMVGTPAQIAALTLGRDGAPTVDVAALLAGA